MTGQESIKKPSTAQLVAFSALGPFSMHLIIPAITPIQQQFGITAGTASLLISATLWGIASSTLFFGVLADRFGRRPMLMLGIGLFVIGSLMGELGDSASMVIAGRVVQGIGGSTGMVISRAVIRDLYARDKGTSVLAYLTMVIMIAPIMAPAFAGYVVQTFGWRVIFDITALLGFAVLTWLIATFPETVRERVPLPNVGAMLQAYFSVLTSRIFLFYTLVGTFIMTSFFSMMSGAPHVAELAWGIGRDELGYYLGIGGLGMVASTFITARIAERVDNHQMMLTGLCIILLGTTSIVVLFAVGVDHPLSLFGPSAITGFGAGFVMPTTTTGALSVTPRMAGTASGMMTFLQFLVAGIAAQAIGYFDHHTPWSVIGFMVVFQLLAVGTAVAASALARAWSAAE